MSERSSDPQLHSYEDSLGDFLVGHILELGIPGMHSYKLSTWVTYQLNASIRAPLGKARHTAPRSPLASFNALTWGGQLHWHVRYLTRTRLKSS